MASQFNPQVYNSVSFVDVVALDLGLHRLPGETAPAFLDRLYQASVNVRNHTLEGSIDQIAFSLGLSAEEGIEVLSPDPSMVISSSFGQILFLSGSSQIMIPLLTIAVDNYWTWRKLSDVVADINALTNCTATLLTDDGPAWQIPRQTSLDIVIGEAVTNQRSTLSKSGIVVGSERFNVTVPAYKLTTAGDLAFLSTPPANTEITYMANHSPFRLTVSEVGAFSLRDKSLAQFAAGTDGGLVYQLREYTQALMSQDLSYWGK